LKVVLDVNVLIAAEAARGLCLDVVVDCLARHEIILCNEMLVQMRRALGRKLGAPREMVDRLDALYREQSRIVTPLDVPRSACRDPDDLPVLGTALAGGASVIVTGDNDLLVLGSFGGTRIITPRRFLEDYRAGP